MTQWNLGAKAFLALSTAALATIGLGTRPHEGIRVLQGLKSHFAAKSDGAGNWQPGANAIPVRSPLPMQIGVTLPGIASWGTAVPFTNLAKETQWLLNWGPLPEGEQDNDGRLFGSGPEKQYHLPLLIPTSTPDNYKVTCTWTGSGTVSGAVVGSRTVATGPGRLVLAVAKPIGRARVILLVTGVDPARPLSNLDCRGQDSVPNARFRPGFVQALRGYKALRFMEWQNANRNAPVTWATRHTPASIRGDQDGFAIEDMMALANEVGADPWFVMPWNADNAYYENFARMVRDSLPAGRHVYVETGNEIWNTGFPAGRQAQSEGLSEGLSKDPNAARMMRYAEKTIHVMSIWEKVFAGHPGLVRVVTGQNTWPVPATIVMGFRGLPAHVDALATAPYFGFSIGGKNIPYQLVIDKMKESMIKTEQGAALNQSIARHYRKRFITYEGGQSTELFADSDTERKVQYSQDMYEMYKQYLNWWHRDYGDLIVLFNAISPIGRGSAWGQVEYETDTPVSSPKLRAIVEARGS